MAARSAPSCLNLVRFVKELSSSHTIPKMDHLHFGDIWVATRGSYLAVAQSDPLGRAEDLLPPRSHCA